MFLFTDIEKHSFAYLYSVKDDNYEKVLNVLVEKITLFYFLLLLVSSTFDFVPIA